MYSPDILLTTLNNMRPVMKYGVCAWGGGGVVRHRIQIGRVYLLMICCSLTLVRDQLTFNVACSEEVFAVLTEVKLSFTFPTKNTSLAKTLKLPIDIISVISHFKVCVFLPQLSIANHNDCIISSAWPLD